MFDPYHKWLGIAKEEQPPTHYRLLGINANETDRDVIEEAAIRQTTHVRTNQIGPHAAACTRLLNEIAHARSTLLDPAKRREYDLTLASKRTAPRSGAAKSGHAKSGNPWLWAALASGVVTLGVLVWAANSLLRSGNNSETPIGPETRQAETDVKKAPSSGPSVPESAPTPPQPKKPATVVPTAKALVPELSLRKAVLGGKGTWHIDGEHLISDNKASWLEFGDPAWKDYDFSFVAERTTGEVGVAAIFRAARSSSNDRYAALLPSRALNGFFFMMQQRHMGTVYQAYDKKGKGLPGRFAGKTSPMQPGNDYRIKISVRGPDCECFVDDMRVLQHAKLEYDQGAVGIQNLAGGTVRIRDITVRGADGRIFWEGLPALP